MRGVILSAQQSRFFRRREHEIHRTGRLLPRAHHGLRDRELAGAARRVVVGAVEDAVRIRLVARLRIAHAEMIVMRGEHDGLHRWHPSTRR